MYSFRNSILNVRDNAPVDFDLNSYNDDFYNLTAKSIYGKIINFSQYKGKKILIVNVASKCGYTPQYEDLQVLHKKYGDKVTILAFPSNNFGFQEPGSNDEIIDFIFRGINENDVVVIGDIISLTHQTTLINYLKMGGKFDFYLETKNQRNNNIYEFGINDESPHGFINAFNKLKSN